MLHKAECLHPHAVYLLFSHLWALVLECMVSALGQSGLPVSQSAELQMHAQFCVLTVEMPEEGVKSKVCTMFSWETGLPI